MKKIKLWQSVQRIAVLLVALFSVSHVMQAQSISISADKTDIVLGESVVITANLSGFSGEASLKWVQKEEGTFFPLDLSDTSNPITLAPQKNTEYYAECDGVQSNIVTIKVTIPKHLVISASKTELALGESVTLTASSQTGLALNEIWWQKRFAGSGVEDIKDESAA